MERLHYEEVTKVNIYEIARLSLTLPEEQQKCVAPNGFSIAEGSVHSNAYYRGIYDGKKPVGFFMLSIPNEDTKNTDKDRFYLWRFMIAYKEQHKHYGSEVLDYIVQLGKKFGHKELYTSCHIGDVSPYDFYIKYGFTDTGRMEDNEQVLRLNIT